MLAHTSRCNFWYSHSNITYTLLAEKPDNSPQLPLRLGTPKAIGGKACMLPPTPWCLELCTKLRECHESKLMVASFPAHI